MSEFGLEIAFALLRSTAVIAAALLLAGRLGRRAPRSGVAVLGAACFLLLALSLLPFLPLIPAASGPGNGAVQPHPGHALRFAAATMEGLRIRVPLAEPSPGPSGALAALALLYAVFAAASLTRLAGDWRASCRLRNSGTPVVRPDIEELVRELAAERGWRHPIEIRQGTAVDLAAVAGSFRPVILLAPEWREWSGGELRSVLRHEIAHVVHRDYVLVLLARLTQAANALQPLAGPLVERLRWFQERAADQSAAGPPAARGPYIAALARLALGRPDCPPALPNPLAASAGSRLVRRLQMLTQDGDLRIPSRAVQGIVIGTLVLLALGLGYVGGQQSWPEPPRPAAAAAKPRKPYADHKIVPGDVLGVFVECVTGEKNSLPPVHSPAYAGDNYAIGYPMVVDERGELLLPYIEPVKVEGLTPRETQLKIRDIYIKRNILVEGFERVFVSLIKAYDEGT